jgi:hypothetical protein
MAGIVENDEIRPFRGEAYLRDGGIVRFDPKHVVEIDPKEVAEIGLDDATMGHHHQVAIWVSCSKALEGNHSPLLEGADRLASRRSHSVKRGLEPAVISIAVSAPDLLRGLPLPRSQADLLKALDDQRPKTDGLTQHSGCLHGPSEWAAVQAGE